MITAILRYKVGASRTLRCTGDVYRTDKAITMETAHGDVVVPLVWLNVPLCSFIKEDASK